MRCTEELWFAALFLAQQPHSMPSSSLWSAVLPRRRYVYECKRPAHPIPGKRSPQRHERSDIRSGPNFQVNQSSPLPSFTSSQDHFISFVQLWHGRVASENLNSLVTKSFGKRVALHWVCVKKSCRQTTPTTARRGRCVECVRREKFTKQGSPLVNQPNFPAVLKSAMNASMSRSVADHEHIKR